jgi:hypothetical protein
MSMILLEPANTILYNSLEDQAADHLINGDFTKFDAPNLLAGELAQKPTFKAVHIESPSSQRLQF